MDNNQLSWNHSAEIAVPALQSEKRLAIRVNDWERIKRGVARQKQSLPSMSVAYSILFGVGGSSGFTVIPLYYTTGLPNWVIPLYVVVTIFSLIVAVILVWFDSSVKKRTEVDTQELALDMQGIEQHFKQTGGQAPENTPSKVATP